MSEGDVGGSQAGARRSRVLAVVESELALEAQRNERRVGLIRVGAFGTALALDLFLAAAGIRPLRDALPMAGVVALSSLVLVALRGGRYRPWFRFAIPLLDFALIGLVISLRLSERGPTAGLISSTSLSCGLFAATGGIRFDRAASAWTTALAAALLVLLLGHILVLEEMAYALLGVAAIGGLNVWLTQHVRRAVEAARGKELLRRFLPEGLVDSAFSDPGLALAEPRSVEATVLVTDLRGFTALAEGMRPADVLATLNDLQGALAEAVRRSGGVVDKFMGDGMLAVFGAHGALPDHAARALAAAREIRRALEAYNAARPPERRLRMGMGLHSGPLVAGLLGSGERLELTIIGDTVNTASRLESLTKEQGVDVLLSGEVADRVGVEGLRPLGEASVRGRQRPLRLFTLA